MVSRLVFVLSRPQFLRKVVFVRGILALPAKTKQCRGGPLGSWLPVARLAIPSHGEPAKQGQGCQRENQATICYFAACQVFFHLPGVSSWLSQKIPRSNFARKGDGVHCIIARKHHHPVSQRASKPDLFLIF